MRGEREGGEGGRREREGGEGGGRGREEGEGGRREREGRERERVREGGREGLNNDREYNCTCLQLLCSSNGSYLRLRMGPELSHDGSSTK